MSVRVRFAPSPTGPLHIGGVRTALFNYLFAKANGGTFIVRVEDTDRKRFEPKAEEYIFNALQWLGINPDESCIHGGDKGPYRQSERNHLYKKYIQYLLDNDKAYYAFDTTEEIEEMREKMKENGIVNNHYGAISRLYMNNSLTWDEKKVTDWIEAKKPYVVRFKVPIKGTVEFIDQIRGKVTIDHTLIDDKVLMKSDGFPTYHLANVVDDYLMNITHVIRGEEWLSSTPLHHLLYNALDMEMEKPQFAHLPLILKPNGNGKLSKRDAEKGNFPIFPLTWESKNNDAILGYKEKGYLPEALINFLALLGWNPGTDEEMFSLDELCDIFDLNHVQKKSAKFDIEKAVWFNHNYLSKKPESFFISILEKEYGKQDTIMLSNITALLINRISFPSDLIDKSRFFFESPKTYDQKVIKKRWNETSVQYMDAFFAAIVKEKPKDKTALTDLFSTISETEGISSGKVMQAIRVCLTGEGSGVDLIEIILILGANVCYQRYEQAKKNIQISQ